MLTTKERGNETPPPNYASLHQNDDEISEIVISKENNIPLLQNHSNSASKSHATEVNDT